MWNWFTRRRLVLCVLIASAVGLVALADDPITSQASFLGGAGATATNEDYTLVSSWRQQTQTSVSSGEDYINASGFLAAISSDAPSGFRILSFEMQTSPTNLFKLTIPTAPGSNYVVQFTDTVPPTGNTWQQFQNTNEGIGSHLETNSAPSVFTFADDFTPATSGGASASAARFYRVVINAP